MSVGTYADLLRALGQNESGNNYSFVSSVGYLGRFQFSEEALKAIGFYNGDGTHALDFVGSWTEAAHNLGVWDKGSFLATPAAQDAAQDAWFQKVWQDATALNLPSYIGQWVGGVQVTASGILAGSHLVGVWNLKSWLESGGAVDTRDPYGTPVSQYVGKFGGYDTPFSGAPAAGPGPSSGGGQNLVGGDWADQLHGGAGADTLSGGGGANLLRGQAGDDSLQGGWAFDDLHGNTGNDTVAGGGGDDWVVGGQDNDLLFGDDGHDVVLGNLGADRADGGAGNDVVRGGQGDDSLSGGTGDDWLSGDRGSDTISGGSGADTFHLFEGSNADLVLDFSYWEGDRVDVTGSYWVSQTDQGVAIDVGDGRMILQGVQLSSLPDGWIF